MSKRPAPELGSSYWDWLPEEVKHLILRFVRLDAARLLHHLVANKATFNRLSTRFDINRDHHRPSWHCVEFMQRVFTRGPLLNIFQKCHYAETSDGRRDHVNHFFAWDGLGGPRRPPGTPCWWEITEDIQPGFRNVDALVECNLERMFCAYTQFENSSNSIEDEIEQAFGPQAVANYYCDTFEKLRSVVKRAFERPPSNRVWLRTIQAPKSWSL